MSPAVAGESPARRGLCGGRYFFSLRLGHGGTSGGAFKTPSAPPKIATDSIVSFAKTGGCAGWNEAIPPLKFGTSPPFFARFGGVGVKAVSALSPRIPLIFLFPLLVLAFYFPARRRSQGAKGTSPRAEFRGCSAGRETGEGRKRRLMGSGGLSRSAGRREPRIGSPLPLSPAVCGAGKRRLRWRGLTRRSAVSSPPLGCRARFAVRKKDGLRPVFFAIISRWYRPFRSRSCSRTGRRSSC